MTRTEEEEARQTRRSGTGLLARRPVILLPHLGSLDQLNSRWGKPAVGCGQTMTHPALLRPVCAARAAMCRIGNRRKKWRCWVRL